ncbi:glycosyltransferase family 4 protein [Gaoshiqia sediminis]|uniref:Glycosyltransferase family 4 protein n=1 Tax=Gaoshiqia sediminis TaxID=2986998 RepID=A0AA42C5S9_9BACT|nr:glycosyltransferase family 4 protein [Gaoshiqia sediminis]MCW0483183.1 glycosyltransferase family 4 protein [Gaoshiqia sediminis]
MKILWISNTLFPAVCQELNIPSPVVGGWMFSGAEALLKASADVELGVATLYSGKSLKTLPIDGITYYLLPKPGSNYRYSHSLEPFWKRIRDEFKPDVVHIHGTEYPHGLAYVNACGNSGVVASIQGLVSIYAQYYLGGIPEKELRQNITIRDIIRLDSLFKQKQRFQQRGAYEIELIRNISHIIGRTSWDQAHAWAINPRADYHFSNETLRNAFYNHKWKYEECEKHSIFLSQAHYPIKGLHQLIKALPLVLRDFPKTKVYVAGNDFFSTNKFWRMNGYGKYIRSLMQANGISDQLVFTGILSEKEMCDRYLRSNVFVCPSSIENSPNSIGEAQLLGVPCIASYVGGTADMVSHNQTGLLYRFEETTMLAELVCRVFKDPDLSRKLSDSERSTAGRRHDPDVNTQTLIKIYQSACN